MERTVKAWLELLPPEIRDKALKRLPPDFCLPDTVGSLKDAIRQVTWGDQFNYWIQVYQRADAGEFDRQAHAAPSDHDRMPKYSWNHVFAEGYNTSATDSDKFNDTEDCSY